MTIGTVRWFGRSWGASICDPEAQIDAPVGEECGRCALPIYEDDLGITTPLIGVEGRDRLAYHLDCFLASLGQPPLQKR